MLTTDLSLRFDPVYEKISETFSCSILQLLMMHSHVLGSNSRTAIWDRSRYLGPEVPKEELIWQDPIPALNHELVNNWTSSNLKKQILEFWTFNE
jgi:catalase-peroxidase